MTDNDSGTDPRELFRTFFENLNESGEVSDEVAESVDRVLAGEGTEEDEEVISEAFDDWLTNLLFRE